MFFENGFFQILVVPNLAANKPSSNTEEGFVGDFRIVTSNKHSIHWIFFDDVSKKLLVLEVLSNIGGVLHKTIYSI